MLGTNSPPPSSHTTLNVQSTPINRLASTTNTGNVINLNPLRPIVNPQPNNNSSNPYENAFVKVFSRQVSKVIGDFWIIFISGSLTSFHHLYIFIIIFDLVGDWKVFKFGFWTSRVLVNLAWIPTILSSARLASSRRRKEIIICHAAYFLFLFVSCYLCFMLFKL